MALPLSGVSRQGEENWIVADRVNNQEQAGINQKNTCVKCCANPVSALMASASPPAAKSVAYADPASGATSGIHLAQTLGKLGVAAELKPKICLVSPPAGQSSPRVGEVVQHGEAEIGIQPISELIEVDGIDVVGPLLVELQSPDLTYMAGLPTASEQPLSAKALIDFLAAPAAAPVYKAKGMEQG